MGIAHPRWRRFLRPFLGRQSRRLLGGCLGGRGRGFVLGRRRLIRPGFGDRARRLVPGAVAGGRRRGRGFPVHGRLLLGNERGVVAPGRVVGDDGGGLLVGGRGGGFVGWCGVVGDDGGGLVVG